MKNNEWFIIDDISKFIESTRVLVFNAFGKTEEASIDELSFLITSLEKHDLEELNKTLTQEECMNIAQEFIKEQTNKKTNETRFIISTKGYMQMIESFNSRMVSNMLNHLTNIGILESAYDDKSNDFVFWIKNENDKNEKPETD